MSRIKISLIDPGVKAEASLQLYTIANEKYSQSPVIIGLVENIKQKADELITAIGPHYDKEKTKKIRELDAGRDSVFSAICSLIEVHSKKDLYPENHEIASQLLENITPEGLSFLRGPDLLESALLKKSLVFLTDDKNKSFLESINAISLVEKLDTLNKNFMDVHQSRIESKNEKPQPIKQFDKLLNKSINALYNYVHSLDFEDEKMNDLFRPLLDAHKRKQTPPAPAPTPTK
jgi:Family of unknown function (DUF6261)